MQEEVENKTVRLAISTSKMTGQTILKALRVYLNHRKGRKMKKFTSKNVVAKGKQSVKELIGQGQGVSSLDIGDTGLKDFEKIARKYGVDFAVVKDTSENKERYTIFFKAKDADAITKIVKDYSEKQLQKDQKRPSVIEHLQKLKDMMAGVPHKASEKWKVKER